MIPHSLRGRVAFAAAAATAVVILLGGGIVTLLVSRAEHVALDNRLREQSLSVEAPLEAALANGVSLSAPDFYLQRPDIGTIVRVYRGDGLVLAAGSPAITFNRPAQSGYDFVVADNRRWRVLSSAMSDPQTTLLVAVPERATNEVVSGIRRQVIYVAAVSAGLAAMAGYFLGGVALRPLGRLRNVTDEISSSRNLGVRVPDSEGPQEIDDLAKSFNVMLERLQAASRSTEAALQSSRAFAGNAAHEMRTPLTSMQANLEVLTRNPDLPQQQTVEIVTALSKEQRRLVRLIDALHILARGDVVGDEQKEVLDLADLTGVAIESSRRSAGSMKLSFQIPGEATEVFGWADGLRLMVDNLLTNAIRHGGDQVVVTLEENGSSIVLNVDDDGPGVDMADRERIFNRFERGKGVKTPGTGLGLALVAQQARLHHGTVVVVDSPLGGARFSVTLPRDGAPDERRDADKEP